MDSDHVHFRHRNENFDEAKRLTHATFIATQSRQLADQDSAILLFMALAWLGLWLGLGLGLASDPLERAKPGVR